MSYRLKKKDPAAAERGKASPESVAQRVMIRKEKTTKWWKRVTW